MIYLACFPTMKKANSFCVHRPAISVCVHECCCFQLIVRINRMSYEEISALLCLGGMLHGTEMEMKSKKKWKPLNARTHVDRHTFFGERALFDFPRKLWRKFAIENWWNDTNCRFVPAIASAHATQIFTHRKLSFAANSISSPALVLLSTPTRILIELFVHFESAHWKFLFTLIASFTCVKWLNARNFQFLLCSS